MLKFVYFQHTSVDIQMKLKMLHWPFLYPTSVNSKEDKGKPRLIHIITLELFVISYFFMLSFYLVLCLHNDFSSKWEASKSG